MKKVSKIVRTISLEKYRSVCSLKMAEGDLKLTSVSFKSNLDNTGLRDDMENILVTPGGAGGALSLIPSVAAPNDLFLVTDRFNSATK